MEILDCLHIVIPGLLGILLAVGAPIGYKVYQTSVKATASYLLGAPIRLFGYVATAYSSKVTKVLAVATALGGTIKAGATALSTGKGFIHIAKVFVKEIYRETLSATGLLSQGFQTLTEFLSQPGVCSTLLNLDMLGIGVFYLWRGLAVVIVVLTLWGYYRSRGRKTEIDFDEKMLVIIALFSTTTLINIATSTGTGTPGIVALIENSVEFFNTLSESINGIVGNTTATPDNETFNQTLNSTNNASR